MHEFWKSARMGNNHLSEYFIFREIREGDSTSALFIIHSERLAETIRSSIDMKAIAIGDVKDVRTSQYVDNTNVFPP